MKRRAFVRGTAFLALFGLVQLASEYQVIYAALSGAAEATQREDFRVIGSSAVQSLADSWRSFLSGQYHADPLQRRIILPTAVAALAVLLLGGKWLSGANLLRKRAAFWLSAAIGTSVIYGFWTFAPIQDWWSALQLPYVNLSRFHWLQPMIWGAIFALSLGVFAAISAPRRVFGLVAVCVLGGAQISHALQATADLRQSANVTFTEYVSEHLFEQIRDEIGEVPSSYRIASIGLDPAISQMNGFHTVDGYMNLYPLQYKVDFRNIISKEIDDSKKISEYYDDWGSRVYLFTGDTFDKCKWSCTKESAPSSISIKIDTEALLKLGGRFLISVSVIEDADVMGLLYRGVFDDDESPWRVFLYEIKT